MKKKILALLAVALLTFSAVPVMAANSPTAAPVYNITINNTTVSKDGNAINGGKIVASTDKIEAGKSITLTATADAGKKFSKWVLPEGGYTIVSGSLTDATITVIPTKDNFNVNAEFVDDVAVTTAGNNETTVVSEDTDVDDDDDADVDDDDDEDVDETTASKGVSDNSGTSPKTGVATGAILATLLASGGIAVASKKKSK